MSATEPTRRRVHRYEGESVTVLYELKRCIHAGACVGGLPEVFRPRETPWIRPDAAGEEALLATVLACPTGALKAERRDGTPIEPAPAENVVELCPDGPFYARGNLEILDADGALITAETRVALCRCGASATKPFCDGAHAKVEFTEPGVPQAVTLRDDPVLAEARVLRITVRPNGPLLLEGPVKILAADGSVCAQGARGALCRCGLSGKKPICDGSHKERFVA